MEAILEKIDLKHLDKSGWKSYRIDKIAKNISERVDPNNTDLEIYVGLEHLDSESIHIRRTGTKGDVNGTKLRFYSGDIIFGRRRAYQRKAAIANFDGFCSAHGLVLRANPEVIDPNLFPFFLHSDMFMHRAVDISVGSLSPTINWGTLKTQEFLLPPNEQQEQLAELLWAMDGVIEKRSRLSEVLNTQLLLNEFKSFYGKENHKLKYIIKDSLSGGTPDTKKQDEYYGGDIPWITTKILEGDSIDLGEKYITRLAVEKSAAKVLPAGNLIAGTRVGVGKFALNTVDISFSQDITGLMIDKDKIDLQFLIYQLNSRVFQRQIQPFLRGTTIKGITKEDLLNLSISVPKKEIQEKVKIEICCLKKAMSNLDSQIMSSKVLQKSLIKQIF